MNVEVRVGRKKNKQRNANASGSRKGDWIDPNAKLGNNPFAALAARKAGSAKASSTPSSAPVSGASQGSSDELTVEGLASQGPQPRRRSSKPGPARAVLRLERKGRGGKTVTVVSHLGLSDDELGVWCRELRKGLGCGGQVEEDKLVFNGDHRDRLVSLLDARGVRKVTRG